MNTNLPFSQADLEAMRTGSAHAVAEMGWAWMMTVDAREPHGGTKEDFQSALVKAGLLQDNSNKSEAYFERTTGEQLSGPVTEEFRQISLKKRPVKEKLTEEEQIEKRKTQ